MRAWLVEQWESGCARAGFALNEVRGSHAEGASARSAWARRTEDLPIAK